MPATPDLLSAVLRIVSFVLLFTATGAILYLALFRRYLLATQAAVRRLALRSSIAALAAVLAHQVLDAARMAADMSGILDLQMQSIALHSAAGAAFAAKLAGLAIAAIGLRWRAQWLALAGAFAALSGFTLTGHTAVSPHSPATSLLLLLHLLIIAFWMGSLWPLYRAAGAEPAAGAANLVAAFSRIASWLVPLILVAGAGLAALLVPGMAVFHEPYGRLLLTKIGLFAALMCLAALNKYRLGRACAEGNSQAFRASVAAEYVIICGVLAVTAVMTMFYSPEVP